MRRVASALVAVSVAVGPGAVLGAPGAVAEGGPWHSEAVRIEPLDPAGPPLTLVGSGAYRGALEVRPAGGGLAVVNDVALEDYVRGIGEVPASWPAAALEAQAVAARTYALWQRAVDSNGAFRQAGADICATQACQVYRGVAAEQRPGGDRWVAAVEATRGQLLMADGRIVPAMYSSSNGGGSVSGGVPWLPAVDDPDDLAASPYAHWEARFPLDRVAAALPGDGRLLDVTGGGAGLVVRREVAGGAVTEQQLGGRAFRSAMNAGPAPGGLPVAIPSTRFRASTVDGTVVVQGGGFGHLLGMSQYGALGKARRGFTSAQILAAYYGGITPTTLPSDRLPSTIRVALDLGADRAVVDLAAPARVIARDGTVLATVASGRWELRPDGAGGVEVVPPPGADAPLGMDVLGVDPAGLHLRLSTPAQVRVGPPGAAPQQVAALGAGEHVLPVTPGDLVVEADAGAGRRVSLAVPADGGPAVPLDAPPAATAPAVVARAANGPDAVALPADGLASTTTPRELDPRVPAAAVAAVALLLALAAVARHRNRTSRAGERA